MLSFGVALWQNMKLLFAILSIFVFAVGELRATVQITRLNSPLSINSFYQFEDPEAPDPLCIDFNHDGKVDLRIAYFFGGIDVYFDNPTRIVIAQHFYPWTTNVTGSTGALPFGAVIGTNLVSNVDTNVYIWHWGTTNSSNETREFGDHRSVGVYVLDPATIGMPLIVGGDPADKEGVLAVEFLIGTNRHYGYIHFDFRKEIGWYKGSGGYILGWAYETEPNKAILALPISIPPTSFRLSVGAHAANIVDLGWRATPGATYRLQGTSSADGPFVDFTPDIVPPNGLDASPIEEIVTIYGMQDFPSFFWRVVRIH
jgi:hypothetical protein